MSNGQLTIRDFTFEWGKRTYLMGILNVTPDSFSDGGAYNTLDTALFQAQKLVQDGADILDIGGQSTRPGAEQVTLEEELNRVIPIIKKIRSQANIPISIDTTRAEVAEEAIKVGADIVNDISGATFDDEMLKIVAKLGVPLILMHIKGTPKTMQNFTIYNDLIGEIIEFLKTRINAALVSGIKHSHLIIDPGIGFGKTYEQNLEILRKLREFTKLNLPILVGTSRKSFIGKILNQDDPKQRIWGTAATCCTAIANGGDIMRIHDVAEMRDVCKVADAIYRNSNKLRRI
jgi:dihydropteroate synthase